ncbi:MAG: hypothetical protein HY855_10845 [Burkholderiales bacterium]|nr:hypothetical protein [Burkholderiales bacterium]
MWRILTIVLLAFGVVGFGACALCAGVYGASQRNAREFLFLSLVTAVLTALCIWGLKKLRLSAPRKAAPPPPPPAPPTA